MQALWDYVAVGADELLCHKNERFLLLNRRCDAMNIEWCYQVACFEASSHHAQSTGLVVRAE